MKTEKQIEKVSAIIHELWMTWAKELMTSESLSKNRIQRWETKCFLPYAELSEEMKDLDRKFAKQIILSLG